MTRRPVPKVCPWAPSGLVAGPRSFTHDRWSAPGDFGRPHVRQPPLRTGRRHAKSDACLKIDCYPKILRESIRQKRSVGLRIRGQRPYFGGRLRSLAPEQKMARHISTSAWTRKMDRHISTSAGNQSPLRPETDWGRVAATPRARRHRACLTQPCATGRHHPNQATKKGPGLTTGATT